MQMEEEEDSARMLGRGSYYNFDSGNHNPPNGHNSQEDAEANWPQPDVRVHQESGERYCLPAILRCLQDSDWNVRCDAAITLGRLGDLEGIPGLVQALKDERRSVRTHAAASLERMDTPEAPIMVRVLLSETLSRGQRADILNALTHANRTLFRIFGSSSTEDYCTAILEQETPDARIGLDPEEREAMARLRASAEEVLEALKLRREAGTLLRAASADHSNAQHELLRSTNSPANHHPESLLRPTEQGSGDGD